MTERGGRPEPTRRPQAANPATASRPDGASPAVGKAAAAISPARAAAFAILERVANTSAHSDDLLHGPGMSAVSQLDRNLATTLVLGVLRWQIALDARIRPLLQRPEVELASPVATALRLGAFQLLHLDRIPAHAALSESVELVRSAGHGHAAGMVNAVLRKLTRQQPVKPKLYETTAALAERLGHPGWLMERWVREYGRAAALAVCEYDQQPPARGELFAASAPEAAGEALPGESEPGGEAGAGGAEAPVLEAQGAEQWAEDQMPRMDDGSRLVAELAAASWLAAELTAGGDVRRVWDCCAAPGGKTMVLARRLPGAEILATDINPRRAQALAERLASATNVRVVAADAAKLPAAEGEFDLVLCDVPCSGTGTLGRNPEIKQRLTAAELLRQAVRQQEILRAVLARLRPGGRLVYSTCSLEPEENERVVEAICAGGGAERLAVAPVLRGLRDAGVIRAGADLATLTRGEYLRTLPGVGFQGDGFFAALLTKR